MLGSTAISAVLGSGVDNTDHDSVRAFIGSACDAGLSLLLVIPGGKLPFDGRTSRKRLADDAEAQEAAKQAGRHDASRVKSASGLALATTDKSVLLRKNGYLDEYIRTFGPGCAVNLAIEVGQSRLVVVDCDTEEQRRRFLEVATGDPDSELPPTVISPGTRNAAGQWVHTPGNGHFWFTIPKGVTLPTNIGALTWGGDEGFAVLWNRRYVLIPPSTRPEGSYELLGRDYEVPGWLVEAITLRAEAKLLRAVENNFRSTDANEISIAIDAWAESVTWASILQPLGWMPTARPDNCGCEVWTAPGLHASTKSATAHDSGCALGRYTETNAPLHIWTDHPGAPFDRYVSATESHTISKLQAVTYADYDGDVGEAMDQLGLGPALTTIDRDMGVSKSNLKSDTAGHDPAADIALPTTPTPPITPPQSPAPFDLTDEDEQPDPDVFEPGINGVPIIAPFSHWRDMPPPEYVIEGLIEHGGLSAIIGPPGVGKSSVALDMACHIATGKPWQGRKSLKTRVLYLPGEGLSGAVQRVKAWGYEHDVPDAVLDDGLRLGNSIIQLGASSEAWGMLAEYVIRQRIGLIIFDTFARMSLGIEENSATEVGRAIVRFDQMRRLTNSGLLIVHHTAKGNPSAARGSSALNGALDSELLISEAAWTFEELGMVGGDGRVPSGKPIQLSTTKQKNAEQLDHPIPLMMRNCSAYDAPFVTGPSGDTDPMLGEIVLARPVDEPVLETAIRICAFADRFMEQGITRADAVAGVRPDPYTAGRRDSTKSWKQKVALAIDLALHHDLLETASGQRLGARYVRGSSSVEQARIAHAAEVMSGDEL